MHRLRRPSVLPVLRLSSQLKAMEAELRRAVGVRRAVLLTELAAVWQAADCPVPATRAVLEATRLARGLRKDHQLEVLLRCADVSYDLDDAEHALELVLASVALLDDGDQDHDEADGIARQLGRLGAVAELLALAARFGGDLGRFAGRELDEATARSDAVLAWRVLQQDRDEGVASPSVVLEEVAKVADVRQLAEVLEAELAVAEEQPSWSWASNVNKLLAAYARQGGNTDDLSRRVLALILLGFDDDDARDDQVELLALPTALRVLGQGDEVLERVGAWLGCPGCVAWLRLDVAAALVGFGATDRAVAMVEAVLGDAARLGVRHLVRGQWRGNAAANVIAGGTEVLREAGAPYARWTGELCRIATEGADADERIAIAGRLADTGEAVRALSLLRPEDDAHEWAWIQLAACVELATTDPCAAEDHFAAAVALLDEPLTCPAVWEAVTALCPAAAQSLLDAALTAAPPVTPCRGRGPGPARGAGARSCAGSVPRRYRRCSPRPRRSRPS